jgi:hypothetical protein
MRSGARCATYQRTISAVDDKELNAENAEKYSPRTPRESQSNNYPITLALDS